MKVETTHPLTVLLFINQSAIHCNCSIIPCIFTPIQIYHEAWNDGLPRVLTLDKQIRK